MNKTYSAVAATCAVAGLALAIATLSPDRPPAGRLDQAPRGAPAATESGSLGEARAPEPLNSQARLSLSSSPRGTIPARSLIRVGFTERDLEDYEGDGVLRCRPIESNPNRVIEVPIRNGIPNWEGSSNGPYVVDSLVLGGRKATPVDVEAIHGNQPVQGIDAVWFPGLVLEVVDSETRRPLDFVSVSYEGSISEAYETGLYEIALRERVKSRDSRFVARRVTPRRGPPAETTLLVRDAKSPVSLESESLQGTFWITAPGYEWRSWPTAGESIDDKKVSLRRAGDLSISVLGAGPNHSVEITPASGGDPVIRKASPVTHIEKLRLGRVLVRLIGPDGRRVDSGTALITQMEEANLTLDASRPQVLGVLAGVLVVEDNAGFLEHPIDHLEALPCDGGQSIVIPLSERILGSLHSLELTPTPTPAGPVALRIPDVPVQWNITVLEGENLLNLSIDDLRERRITCPIEGNTQITLRSLSWSCLLGPQCALEVPSRSESCSGTSHRTILPAGRVELAIGTASQGFHSTTLDVPSGAYDLVVDLAPRACLSIRVLGEDGVVPVSFDWLRRISGTDRDGRRIPLFPSWTQSGSGDPQACLWTQYAGELVLTPPSGPGFARVEATAVTSAVGEERAVVFRTVTRVR